jgi:hypothetical protein
MIEVQGGRLWIESHEGPGTVLRARLALDPG